MARTAFLARIALAVAVAAVAAACALLQAEPGGQRPLSRLTVHNENDAAEYVRTTWLDGLEMTYRIPAGEPVYVSGSIGGGFPAQLEILDAECTVLKSVSGMAPSTQALVTITVQDVHVRPITTGGEWHVTEGVPECRTKPDPP